MSDIILYDYWRSSASYRVRIALNLKNIAYEIVPVDLLTREHLSVEHLERNPQGFIPALAIDDEMLTQSLAIIDYLDETRTKLPLLPDGTFTRQKVRAMAHVIAMDIHPVCNLSVAAYAVQKMGGDDDDRAEWMQHFILKGLQPLEQLIRDAGEGGFCFGAEPTLADICLIPQLYNAARWGADFSHLTRITAIGEKCAEIDAFQKAYPETVKAMS
ncbi:MAG: maleylacetoacetate isomerase [Sneathiella sp.]|nr:MAG: maleylacetoacetate isomerase [Sneathiella sp.]